MILAIDPGRQKCGLAVLDDSKKIIDKKIVSLSDLGREVKLLSSKYNIEKTIMGKGTGYKDALININGLNLPVKIDLIPEKYSTMEAKKRYFIENPPRGLFKFIPSSLLFPLKPIDDYAAVILGERYLTR